MSREGMSARPRPSRPTVRRLGGAVAVLAGLAFCYLGFAQTAAGMLQIRGTATVDMLRSGAPILPQTLAAGIADFERADAWWREPANSISIGVLEATPTAAGVPVVTDQNPIAAAELEFERAIAEAPGSATAWARLAQARFVAEGGSRGTVDALMMSIKLARVDPFLLADRAAVGLPIYRSLSPEERLRVADQVRLLAHMSAETLDQLAEVAHDTGTTLTVVGILSGDLDALYRFDGRMQVMFKK